MFGIVLKITEALTALVWASPQTRNSEEPPGSNKPIKIGPTPTFRMRASWPAAPATRNIVTAPIRKRILLISVTASRLIIDLLAIIVDAQQAVAITIAIAGIYLMILMPSNKGLLPTRPVIRTQDNCVRRSLRAGF